MSPSLSLTARCPPRSGRPPLKCSCTERVIDLGSAPPARENDPTLGSEPVSNVLISDDYLLTLPSLT